MSDNESKSVFVCCQLDKAIYDLIRCYFSNGSVINNISIPEIVDAYKQHGSHQINFERIYD